MNEQLQNALAEILGKTLNGIDAASAFFFSELPDVIQQLLTWYAVKGLLLCLLAFLFGIFHLYHTRNSMRVIKINVVTRILEMMLVFLFYLYHYWFY